MLSAEAVIAKHEATSAAGLLTPSQRMKIRVLRDIIGCAALPKANRQEAERGLAKWEQTAKAHGWTSLAAWEAAR
jgi:hypothetical protein